jgi:putative DNA methylase
MSLEARFDVAFTASLALREKQIQQSYRPVIGVHKWFARRPGTLFRNLLLAEFNGTEAPGQAFYRAHGFKGVIADPFMGGGTPLIEANRLGFHVVGADINPMAYWIVRQEIGQLSADALAETAAQVAADVEAEIGLLYQTECRECGEAATVKYFHWVKTLTCTHCHTSNDLFPGYLLAEAVRHPRSVLFCPSCSQLVELAHLLEKGDTLPCPHCGSAVGTEGAAKRGRIDCRGCHAPLSYAGPLEAPLEHRLWALEYHCAHCKSGRAGRFFAVPSEADLMRVAQASATLEDYPDLRIPCDAIAEGDETSRLRRWGYRYWRELFNPRQLLGLGLLQRRIDRVADVSVREALLTVFSDILRYQNMLCRYDTYALKCQDIFAVHGFPVALLACENNLLGIPGVGAGGFRHFVEKYQRAKAYCRQPFESRHNGKVKRHVPIFGESIGAEFVDRFPSGAERQAQLWCGSATEMDLPPNSLDGVFTDPPYFDNVQYAELMDFCYVWLRQSLSATFPEFRSTTTRVAGELTGNVTGQKGLAHFAGGLSTVFSRFAAALKPHAPFVFTYHHNDIGAYAPIALAILDAGLLCTAVLPAPGEMGASLHINNTASSILDSVFVCRMSAASSTTPLPSGEELERLVVEDCRQVAIGGVRVSLGDARCLINGHLVRLCIHQLREKWPDDAHTEIPDRLEHVTQTLSALSHRYRASDLAALAVSSASTGPIQLQLFDTEIPDAAAV